MKKTDTTDKAVDVGLLCKHTFYFAIVIVLLITINKCN